MVVEFHLLMAYLESICEHCEYIFDVRGDEIKCEDCPVQKIQNFAYDNRKEKT